MSGARASLVAWVLGVVPACASASAPAPPSESHRAVEIPAPPPSNEPAIEPETGESETAQPSGAVAPSEAAPSSDTPPVDGVMVAPTSPPPPAPASSQSAAQQFFEDGRRAMAAGDLATACLMFERSVAADPAIGSMLNLAACQEKLGNKPLACRAYRKAEAMAAGQDDRRMFAADRARALGCP